MADPTVLILSNHSDAHVGLVAPLLDQRGVPYRRLNTETFGSTVAASYRACARRAPEVRLRFEDDDPVDLAEVQAVWYRRPEVPAFDGLERDVAAREFARHEAKAFLDGLQALLRCRWLSRPSAIRDAGHKIEQLGRAQRLGFTVPPTLVSQSPEEIRAFRDEVGSPIVAKLLSKGPPRAPTLGEQYVVMTTPLTDDDLAADETLRICPTLFQPLIPKAFELRVTVVAAQVFACRIDSQATERTKIDWRNYDLDNTPHTAWDMPEELCERCRAIVADYGLSFGAIDLIVTPEEEVVFLELNPNGQWGWIEELTGLPIAEAHARYLSGG